jgi:segregation and condensation protein B
MEISTIIPHIEALVFASDKPLSAPELTDFVNNALGFIEDRASIEQVEAAIEGIKEKYDSEFYAFELKQSGGGWQFLTKPAYHKTVALINADKFIKKLSTASLETLSIIAYKQPITKSEIESIRGVNCDYAVQKLLEKDLVIISGRNEDAVGKPLIYATSKSFMDYFGINSADDLPKIREVLMEEVEKAKSINDILGEQEADALLNQQEPEAKEISGDVLLSEESEEEVVITETIVSEETVDRGEIVEEEIVREEVIISVSDIIEEEATAEINEEMKPETIDELDEEENESGSDESGESTIEKKPEEEA